jgi:hypothetical protein
MGDQTAAHKSHVRGAIEAKEVADGVDEHHWMGPDF